eukprot:g10510.t1
MYIQADCSTRQGCEALVKEVGQLCFWGRLREKRGPVVRPVNHGILRRHSTLLAIDFEWKHQVVQMTSCCSPLLGHSCECPRTPIATAKHTSGTKLKHEVAAGLWRSGASCQLWPPFGECIDARVVSEAQKSLAQYGPDGFPGPLPPDFIVTVRMPEKSDPNPRNLGWTGLRSSTASSTKVA